MNSLPAPSADTRSDILIIALRRSGTTALWKTLRQDQGYLCLDEPLSPLLRRLPQDNKKATWTELINVYRDDPHYWNNIFAPVARNEELTANLTPRQADYLKFLKLQGPVLIDETRCVGKLQKLATVFPEAVMVHLYRHPAAFVSSHIIASQNPRLLRRWLHQRFFFTRPFYFNGWGMEELWRPPIVTSTRDFLYKEGVTPPKRLAPGTHKLMAIWLAAFRRVERDGLTAYGDRFVSLPFEDFCAAPQEHLAQLYALASAPPFEFNTSQIRVAAPAYRSELTIWSSVARAVGFTADEMTRFFPRDQQ